ncbi:hypothetical protein GCM10009760_55750 [Kitasatospora kazusensis]|uniref:Rhodanese domain-containing protein n=1 Tax=Kitasatospora kazusensis TaxID=407974 RepID=A0ABP5LWZ5_9ACTN
MKFRKTLVVVLAAAVPILGLAGPASAAGSSPKPNPQSTSKPPIAAMRAAAATLATRNATGTVNAVPSGPMTFHGGPVQTAPKVYLDFWGWNSDPAGVKSQIIRFYSHVGGSPWLATVSQYGAGFQPGLLAGVWSDPTGPTMAQPTMSDIGDEAIHAASAMGVTASVNAQVIVLLPTGHNYSTAFKSDCGWHAVANGSLPYTAMPYFGDDTTRQCGEKQYSVAGAYSKVGGHELAETMTDPYLNAWYTDSLDGEIGDLCNWQDISKQNVNSAAFYVQSLWSNASNSCTLASGAWTGLMNNNGAPPPGIASGASPTVSSFQQGRLDVFVRGADGAIWHQWWDVNDYSGAKGGWSAWESLGGNVVSNPTAVSWSSSRLDLFAIGGDGNIWDMTWTSTGGWTGWQNFGTPPPGIASGASPVVTSSGNGRLDLFVRGADDAAWHVYYSGGWSGWQSLGGGLSSDPTAVAQDPSHYDVFALGTDGKIWHDSWTGGADWNGWTQDVATPPAGIAAGASPTVVTWNGAPGNLELFIRGKDNSMSYNLYDGSGWGGWGARGGSYISNAAAITPGPDQINWFGIGGDGRIWSQAWA